MKVIVVSDKDEIIGYKDRKDRNQSDIIRVSGLWLVNDKNEVLIAQRALDKIHDPGVWGPSAAGTVEEGETYTSNVLKEAEEELGIVLNEQDLIAATPRFVETSHKYFCMFYFAKTNLLITDFKIQKDEVEQIRWISVTDLKKWFSEKPGDFISSFGPSLKDLDNFLKN